MLIQQLLIIMFSKTQQRMTQHVVIYHLKASLSTHIEDEVYGPNIELRTELNIKLMWGGTKNKEATDKGGI